MRLRNLTPHTIRITDDPPLDLPAEHPTPRLRTADTPAGHDHTIPLITTRVTGVDHLPEPRADVLLIVPRAIADTRPDRTDLLVPNDLVRDRHGAVTACRALARLSTEGQ